MIVRGAALWLLIALVFGVGTVPSSAFQLDEPCRIISRDEVEATLVEFGLERNAESVFKTAEGARIFLAKPVEECIWDEVDGMLSLLADGPDGGYYLISRIKPDAREDAVAKAQRLEKSEDPGALSDASVTADGNVLWVTFQPNYTNPDWRDLLAGLEQRMFLLANR